MLLRIMKNNLLFSIGIIVCALWILIAIVTVLVPSITPYSYLAQDLANRFQAPSSAHWFGTDSIGRDVFSRALVGSRISLIAGLITIALASLMGMIYGGIAGYIGGLTDEIMMRVSEMVMAFPGIILAMTIAAALGPSLHNTLLAMVIIWWPNYARVMRSMVIANKENEYVEAAKSLGASHFRIFFNEIMPNSLGPVLVLATLDFGNAILLFSGLSFLGLGSPPPTPEWGAMVADGVLNFNYWWIGTFPGLAILTMSVGTNFIGDSLRDFLDPRLRKEI
ncbi:ABC transporter permease [Desulfosporosinus lacus]|uniref:Peptide/nickel transport system permease protein n=1 Tax=Desulfosporosinus lacus DSM 15449 TaxID=1121420 RepID=A0A1M5ZVM9_9FIRM|nr:ABC transporter permease [Desulfosporosinus lacus]SHI28304.1 peptide/nickel transport system permease protein [Desulfosporosinus lacus DSM 15449]